MAKLRQPIDLALQGGGAHGAFTWGVLDRLLDEDSFRPAAISGASAGAMNAVVLASALATGGRRAAQDALWSFWKAVNRTARLSNPALGAAEAFPNFFAASTAWWSLFNRGTVSLHPDPAAGRHAQGLLGDVVDDHVDWDAIRHASAPRLFVSATEARSGRLRIFSNADLSREAVLASACLPLAFPAVEIDGIDYWDGGYTANPPLMPLIGESPHDDLLLITITPLNRDATPTTVEEIPERLSDLTFTLSLQKELGGIAIVKAALGKTLPKSASPLMQAVHRLRLHEIHDESTFAGIDPRSKLLPEWRLLTQLRGVGQRAAETWLKQHGDDIGRRSSVEMAERYGPGFLKGSF